jgi:hypothetical protein
VTNETLIRGTLAWCNEVRKARGKKPLKELPRGVRRDSASCPCGKACELHVYATGAFLEPPLSSGALALFPVPKVVREFIYAFDAGEIPEQDLERA